MSTTSLNDNTTIINHPTAPTTSLMTSLNNLHQQNIAFAIGDNQVPSTTPPNKNQKGGRKLYKIQQMSGSGKSFSIQAKNLKEAVSKGFLCLKQKSGYFRVNLSGDTSEKYFYGQQKKLPNGRRINKITPL